jgi:hypothetical protein
MNIEPNTVEEDEKALAAQIALAAVEWKAKWPNHCPACGGWGGITFHQSHPYGMGSASEQLFDECQAIENPTTCHRCGEDGLNEDGEGPCKACGWDFDDGVVQSIGSTPCLSPLVLSAPGLKLVQN